MNPETPTWLAAYLYCAPPWEDFLRDAVQPFAERMLDQRLADQFFFIRYWERGPHIRLRFRGDRATLEQALKPALDAFFSDYWKNHPTIREEPEWPHPVPEVEPWFPNDTVQYIPYEPEVARYGGPAGIGIAEEQFEVSSRAVLAILAESEAWSYDRALGAAIQLHLGFAHALGMDLPETVAFYSLFADSWFISVYEHDPDLPAETLEQRQEVARQAFAESYAQQKAVLVPYHETLWNALEEEVLFEQEWVNTWVHAMKRIGAALEQAQQQGALAAPPGFQPQPHGPVPEARQQLWSIWISYVHMTNNRLGILNRDEAYLSYLMQQSLLALTPSAQPERSHE